MVGDRREVLLETLTARLGSDPCVHSVVLFGSQVRPSDSAASADRWSDLDLHLIVGKPQRFASIDWTGLPGIHLILTVMRPASGGVRKLTVLFEEGEADFVLVSIQQVRLVRFGMMLGLHRKPGRLADALNTMTTIMSGGYRFLKGEARWGGFYRRVVAEMPGVRISDAEAVEIANGFLCDFLCLLQRIDRGEFVATQRILHRSLVETNIILLHELRMRRGAVTFQQARRVEKFAEPDELKSIQTRALPTPLDLRRAASASLDGLCFLMGQLVPRWSVPAPLRLRIPPDLAPLRLRAE